MVRMQSSSCHVFFDNFVYKHCSVSCTYWLMTSCVIIVAGFTDQILPSLRRARWLHGVGHVRWLMPMYKQPLAAPDTLSPN